jgi:heat-inducible transcriptional repressor
MGAYSHVIDSTGVPAEEMPAIAAFLNDQLSGLTLEQVLNFDFRKVSGRATARLDVASVLLDLLGDTVDEKERPQVYLGGATNILNQPEFKDIETLKRLLGLLEMQDRVWDWIAQSADDAEDGISVTIGTENLPEASECSLITAKFHYAGQTIGHLGIMGPTRMPYGRVVGLLHHVQIMLDELLRG